MTEYRGRNEESRQSGSSYDKTPCALGIHAWGRWFNIESGPPYRQRRRCLRRPEVEER